MMRLENKVAIVTGGASGIGASTAKLFAEEGAKVVIADFADHGQAVSDELNGKGYDTLFVKTDVTNEDDVKNMILTNMENWISCLQMQGLQETETYMS